MEQPERSAGPTADVPARREDVGGPDRPARSDATTTPAPERPRDLRPSDEEIVIRLDTPDSPDRALDDPPRPPRRAADDRYVIEGELGRGGMGTVYRAFDRELRRTVAMKVLHDGCAAGSVLAARFVEEAQATAQLQHPGIVPVHEIGVDAAGRLFFTMKLVRGRTLAAVVEAARAGKAPEMTLYRLLQIFGEVARTVGYAHDRGAIHRDLKPHNIMIGSHGAVHVMDWGLVKVVSRADAAPGDDAPVPEEERAKADSKGDVETDAHRTPTEFGALMGTPSYMPPEQAKGQVGRIGPQADVYALGATLYHVLTGRPPFTGTSTKEVVQRVLREPPARPRSIDPGIPRELEAICLRALEKAPEARYQSADALADDVQSFLESRPVSVYRDGLLRRAGKYVRRHQTAAAVFVVAIVLCLAGSAGAFLWSDRERRRAEESSRVAEERAAIARRAFHTMVFDIDSKLAGDTRDSTRALRKELLEASAAGLEELDRSGGGAPEVSVEAARARLAIATNAANGTDRHRAEILTARAVATARALVSATPGDRAALDALIDALAIRGSDRFYAVDLAGACAAYHEAIDIALTLAPDDLSEVQLTNLYWRLAQAETSAGTPGIQSIERSVEHGRLAFRRAPTPANRVLLVRSIEELTKLIDDRDPARAKALRAEVQAFVAAAAAETRGPADGNQQMAAWLRAIKEGDARSRDGDLPGAIDIFERALSELRAFTAQNPEHPRGRRLVSVLLLRLAGARGKSGETSEAVALADEALAMRRAEAARPDATPGVRRDLCIALVGVTQAHLRAGEVAGALRAVEEALRLTRERLKTESESAISQSDLLDALEALADARLAGGDRAGAAAALREAIDAAEPLAGRMETLGPSLAHLRERLRALGETPPEPKQPAGP